MTDYHPPQEILKKYAEVLVNFALGGGKGIRKGEVVAVQATEYSRRLYFEVCRAVWKSGGHVISRFSPDNDPDYNLEREFFELAESHQIEFFPKHFMEGLVEQADHMIFVLSETNKRALQGIDPSKIMKWSAAHKPYMDLRNEKENRGKFTWTIGLYGTPAMAKEAGLSEHVYWNEITRACFLDAKDPIAEWRKVTREQQKFVAKLNRLPIERLNIEGPDTDLWIKIGEKRKWVGGGGRNIPSFEIFTSPDWRGTEGWIKFNQQLYRYGTLIEGVELEFKNGRVIKSKARKNGEVLKHMIAEQNADKVGEFSLTDRRFSRITKFMAETLFDENMGGPNGNTHIALGSAYHDCFVGNPSNVSKATWKKLGFNDSAVHTDIISTSPRTVTAYLKNGKEKIIYADGQFTL